MNYNTFQPAFCPLAQKVVLLRKYFDEMRLLEIVFCENNHGKKE
jgi:hypothetical protein